MAQRKFTDEQVREIFQMNMDGVLTSDIAKYLEVTNRTIVMILEGITYKDVERPEGYVKPKNNLRKLTTRQVMKIKRGARPDRYYAKKYKMAVSSIWRIRKGESYKELKP